jgi:hypothetical protein
MNRRLRSERFDASWLIVALGVATSAVAAAYLFDREQGKARRGRLAQRFGRVDSLIHLPASPESVVGDQWPEEPPPDVDSEAQVG